MKKTIEMKIATNGVKLYYVDGKRTSREVALQATADSRENLFTIEYATRHNAYFTGRILDATQVYESTSKAVLKELELKIDEYHGFTVKLHTIGWVEICKLFNKDYAKSLINKIENAFIRGEYGVKIDKYGKVSILPTPVIEPNPDDYAVTEDALEVAVNAEIQNANNAKINDLKWEIRYTEGSINDLDQNHIAHAPNDESLKERRTELVNELDNLKAQLADLLPNEPNTNSEYKYYLQSRRPIAGAVPNGYISATAGEMKVHSLRSDGSISPVPRKVVFGVVVYDHPLSDQQIINYDLHVDPLNPKVEPDTTPEVDPIIIERETARNEYDQFNAVRKVIEKDCERFERLRDRCKSGSPKHKEYNQLLADFDPIIRAFGQKFIAAQDRYNKSLTLRTDEEKAATQKAIDEHNADLDARGIKYFATVYYYPNGIEGEDMSTFEKDCTSLDEANAFVSQEDIDGVYVGGIYDAGWQITDRNHNLIADHITGIKEEQPMTIEIPAEGTHEFTIGDDTVCFFNGKFHSVFSAKYHMAIVRDLVGCFSYCIYNDGDTEVFNVREHAVSYDNFMETLHQRGNREKLLAVRKKYIITDRLSANNSSMWYVNGKRSSQVKVWNLLQSYGLTLAEFLAEEEAYINECIAASCKQIAIKDQADFLYDKIKRECASIDDSTTDRDEVFNLLPDLDNDVEKVWLTRGELDDLTAKFRAAVSIIPVTTRIEKMLPVTIKITKQNSAKPFDIGFGAFAKYSIVQWRTGLRIMRNFSTLGRYDTPAQVEKVIDLLKMAITRGDKAFTFPTVDELIDPPAETLNHKQKKNLRDSINRAIKQCIRNRIGYLKSHNSKMEKYEYELLCLLQGARRELEVA